jgi:hypothetical protein
VRETPEEEEEEEEERRLLEGKVTMLEASLKQSAEEIAFLKKKNGRLEGLKMQLERALKAKAALESARRLEVKQHEDDVHKILVTLLYFSEVPPHYPHSPCVANIIACLCLASRFKRRPSKSRNVPWKRWRKSTRRSLNRRKKSSVI